MRPPIPVTASRRPSGLKSTDTAAASSARRTRRRRRVGVSIRSTAPSSCVTASVRPSGLTAIPLGVKSGLNRLPTRKRRSRRRSPARSQRIARRVHRARDQRASVTRQVEPVDRTGCVRRTAGRRCPRSTSHASTCPSLPAVTSVRPSGVKRIRKMRPSCPPLSGRIRPEPRSSSRTAAALGAQGEDPPVGADRPGVVPDRPRAHHAQRLGVELPGPVVPQARDEQTPAVGRLGRVEVGRVSAHLQPIRQRSGLAVDDGTSAPPGRRARRRAPAARAGRGRSAGT